MRHELRRLRQQLFLLLGPALALGCADDVGWERCSGAEEYAGEGVPDGPALFCYDGPQVEGNDCPDQERAGRDLDLLLASYLGEARCTWEGEITCGPARQEPDRCCFVVEDIEDAGCPVVGRPFCVAAGNRVAASASRDDWSADLELPDEPLSARNRARLAACWARAGRAEHASVAAFARSSLRLLSLGAPPELLSATAAAMADEVGHARACFGVASALARRPVGPGPLRTSDALDGGFDAATVLRETLIEGCIGETLAAAEAAVAASTGLPPLRALNRRIAEDETRHAALAWRTAAWLLGREPALLPEATAVFARTPQAGSGRDPLSAALLQRYGLLPQDVRAEVARQAWHAVVLPAAEALLRGAAGRAEDAAPGLDC